jgi:hypothetical protein
LEELDDDEDLELLERDDLEERSRSMLARAPRRWGRAEDAVSSDPTSSNESDANSSVASSSVIVATGSMGFLRSLPVPSIPRSAVTGQGPDYSPSPGMSQEKCTPAVQKGTRAFALYSTA